MRLPRRTVLIAGAAAGFARRAAWGAETLAVGDQRGNMRAVMQAAGTLEGLPYRIDWTEFPAAAPLLEAMNAGAIDAGIVGDAPFTFAFAAGVPMRIVAVRRSTQQGLAVVVRGNSPAHSFADLRGRRIATGRGSIGHFLVLAALRKYGWPMDAVELAFLLPADAQAALIGGAVDAWATWEPYTSQVEVIDGGRQVLNGEHLAPGQGFQIASVTAIAAKRDLLADFIARIARARQWANAHPDAYARIWAKLMGVPVQVPRHWFARTRESVVEIDGRAIRDEQAVIDLYAAAGVLHRRFVADAAFDASFNAAVRNGNPGL